MRLLIDTVSNPAAAVVFDDARQAVLIKRESIAGKEYERFLDWISETCRAAGVDLDKLKGIACVRWPAGFTGIRVVVLTLGTLSLVNKTPLFELEYDELWRSSGSKLPVLVRANRDECAVSENGSGFIIRKKSELPGGRYCGNVDESDFEGRNVSVECELDYSAAVRNIKLERPSNRIEPHYLKKPNIT